MNATSRFSALALAAALTATSAFAGPAVPPTPSSTAAPDLLATVQAVANEPDGILRYQRTDDLVATLQEKDIPVVLNLMLLPGTETAGLLDLSAKVFRRWTELAPQRAVAWLGRVPEGTVFGREVYGIAGDAAARANPGRALAWLQQLPDGGNRAAAQFAVAAVIARQDPRRALTLALALPPGSSRDGLLGYCVANWAVTDFSAAGAWVRAVPQAPLRDTLAVRLVTQEAVTNPARAADFVIGVLRPGNALNRSLSQVLHFWAAATPAAAAQWALRLPDSATKPLAIAAVAETWARQDRVGATAWASRLPADRWRDVAAAAIAR